MKRYAIQDLIKKWEREELTVEQTIGQILLWLDFLSKRVTRLEATTGKEHQPQK